MLEVGFFLYTLGLLSLFLSSTAACACVDMLLSVSHYNQPDEAVGGTLRVRVVTILALKKLVVQ